VKGSGQGIFFENYPRFRLFLRQEQFSFFHEVDIELMDAKEGWASYICIYGSKFFRSTNLNGHCHCDNLTFNVVMNIQNIKGQIKNETKSGLGTQ
jgi:hypothetical protein